jgi:sugar-specific transcriptional regulator TrmB
MNGRMERMKRTEKNGIEFGEFCRLYGETLRNRVLEYLLELGSLDFAIGDMAVEIGISKPKAYEIMKNLEKEGFVKKTRIIAGTQLYMLNEKKLEVKQLKRDFKECLKRVLEEAEEKPTHYSSRAGVAVSCKGI